MIPLLLEGQVPDDGLDHFFLEFEVPAGIAEIEVRHDDLSDANILDWGLDDPDGFRGWGGGNAEPAVVGAEAASRSYLTGPIQPGTWRVVVGKAKIVEPPGQYRVEIELREAPTLPAQPARTPWVDPGALATGARWYAGDLHVHSLESGDATATLDEIADLARERGLDFVVITDHNTVSHLDWLGDAQARHPDVLLIPGMEFTTYAGHANAFGVSAWVDHRIGQPGATIEAAAAAFAEQGALLSVNHAELDLGDVCIGCAWEHAFPEPLAGIEVGTGGWDPVGQLFTPLVLTTWEDLASQGRRLAALGGSDDHRAGTDTGPFASPIGDPTTLVWAEALSVEAILAGVAARRTVVKLQDGADPMVDLALGGSTVTASVSGGGDQLVWVVDGVEAGRVDVAGDPFEASLELDGERLRAEVWVAGAPRTLTSHLWADEAEPVEAGAPPVDERGCGCDSTAGTVLPWPAVWLRR